MTLPVYDRTDPVHFRRVLGHYPTGVCVVTALDQDGPMGMTVGSFTSVSLDPALVAFLPMRESGTYQRLQETKRFCVCVLASDQDDLCRLFARRGEDKFDNVRWSPSPSGLPILDGSLAWIECTLHATHEAGDHDIVIGEVTSLGASEMPTPPLLFNNGSYGRFTGLSEVQGEASKLSVHLQLATRARAYVEQLSARFAIDCHATGVHEGLLVQLAYACSGGNEVALSKAGLRLPFEPPMGALFVAWEGEMAANTWLAQLAGADQEQKVRSRLLDSLERIRQRGWDSIPKDARLQGVESAVARIALNGAVPEQHRNLRDLLISIALDASIADPELTKPVHSISTPVFDSSGDVVLTLTLQDPDGRTTRSERLEHLHALREAAASLTEAIGGQSPLETGFNPR